MLCTAAFRHRKPFFEEGGQGGISSQVYESLLILATCLGDLWVAMNSPGKPAVAGSEHTEVWSYIKRLKSEVKSSHQMLVKVVWPKKPDLFSSIDLQCMCRQWRTFGSLCFTECTSIKIHRTVFSKSRFTDTKNGWSQHHENTLAPPPLHWNWYSHHVYQWGVLAVAGYSPSLTGIYLLNLTFA